MHASTVVVVLLEVVEYFSFVGKLDWRKRLVAGGIRSPLGDDVSGELSGENGAFHASEKPLAGVVSGKDEVVDRCSLRGSESISSGNGGVDRSWCPDDGRLFELETLVREEVSKFGQSFFDH